MDSLQSSSKVVMNMERITNERDKAHILQLTDYYPYGLPHASISSEAAGAEVNRRKFGGKELMSDHGYNSYDFAARHQNPAFPHFTTPDQMAESYTPFSLYAYCCGDPINFVDPTGLYPSSLLIYDSKLGFYGGYKFTQSATYLLSLVSGVSEFYIANTIEQERRPGQYRPFYNSNNGGGAITLGTNIFNSNITYTENWFDDNPMSYNGHGYGQNIAKWLYLSSHEVGHLPHVVESNNLVKYILRFVFEYTKYGHDAAPSEVEANKGFYEFDAFYKFINQTYGSGSLERLFNSNRKESEKIETITTWWNSYEKNKKQQTNSYFDNLSTVEQGTYIWIGYSWEKQ